MYLTKVTKGHKGLSEDDSNCFICYCHYVRDLKMERVEGSSDDFCACVFVSRKWRR